MRLNLSRDSLFLLFFIALKFILQFILIHPAYDLHRDEYLHLDQARHLAWGYESVPPLTSWISYLILILGNDEWLVKFFPALFGAMTMLIVWKLIGALKGGLFAKTLGAIAITLSVILRINILYQPNSFDILCWTALFAAVVAYVLYQESHWLYVAAVCFALGFLNKYNIVFLVAGLVPALLLTEQRKIFLNKHLYLAMLLSILMIAPNLVWQYQHDFPVIRHMQALNETQLVNINRVDFLKEQLLFFISSIYIVVAALLSFFTYQPFKKLKFLAYSFVITLATFIFLKAKSYYAIGLYPVFFSFGCVFLEHHLQRKTLRRLRPVILILAVLLSLPLLKIAFPIKHPQEIIDKPDMYSKLGMLRWEDGKEHSLPQDFADMLGWKELARKVDEAQTLLKDEENTLILCDNYDQAGALNYSSKKKRQAVSFNADYKNWFDLGRPYQHMIRVKEFDERFSTIQNNQRDFGSVLLTGRITDSLAREAGTTIYLMKNSKVNLLDSVRNYLRKASIF